MEINDMPDELLLMIFSKLPPVVLSSHPPLVCRRWRDLITSQILVLRKASQLHDLHGGLTVILATQQLPMVYSPSKIIFCAATMAPRLRELTIHCKLQLGADDYAILATIGTLRYLDVFSASCVLNTNVVLAHGITSFVANDNMDVGFLSTACANNKIKSFHMYGRSLHYIPRELISFIRLNSVHLQELTLRCKEMSDTRLSVLSRCNALSALRLYSCWMLTSVGTEHLARPGLRCLHMTGARMVRHGAMTAFVARLPPLIVELNLSATSFGDEHCRALAERLPGLARLELWRCRLSPGALLALALALPRLQELSTDVRFDPDEMDQLVAHPALRDLRCLQPWEQGRAGAARRVRVHEANTVGSTALIATRGDGDGPSANTFYRWSEHVSGPLRLHTGLHSAEHERCGSWPW